MLTRVDSRTSQAATSVLLSAGICVAGHVKTVTWHEEEVAGLPMATVTLPPPTTAATPPPTVPAASPIVAASPLIVVKPVPVITLWAKPVIPDSLLKSATTPQQDNNAKNTTKKRTTKNAKSKRTRHRISRRQRAAMRRRRLSARSTPDSEMAFSTHNMRKGRRSGDDLPLGKLRMKVGTRNRRAAAFGPSGAFDRGVETYAMSAVSPLISSSAVSNLQPTPADQIVMPAPSAPPAEPLSMVRSWLPIRCSGPVSEVVASDPIHPAPERFTHVERLAYEPAGMSAEMEENTSLSVATPVSCSPKVLPSAQIPPEPTTFIECQERDGSAAETEEIVPAAAHIHRMEGGEEVQPQRRRRPNVHAPPRGPFAPPLDQVPEARPLRPDAAPEGPSEEVVKRYGTVIRQLKANLSSKYLSRFGSGTPTGVSPASRLRK